MNKKDKSKFISQCDQFATAIIKRYSGDITRNNILITMNKSIMKLVESDKITETEPVLYYKKRVVPNIILNYYD